MRFIFLFISYFCTSFLTAAVPVNGHKINGNTELTFMENKGQVGDQHSSPRPDVLFSGSTSGFLFHLKNTGISYQFSRPTGVAAAEGKTQLQHYRLDIDWPGANVTAKASGHNPLEGYCNFYRDQCPFGALNVKSYREVRYSDLYPGIDLKWYQVDGALKYDYELKAGADYRQIKLAVSGAQRLSINAGGCLVLETPLGNIIEEAPLVKQQGRTLPSEWVLREGVASFEISGIDATQPFVIDPMVRDWGTFYGGSGNDWSLDMTSDASGTIYVAGYTTSTGSLLATSGAHQVSYAGSTDAFQLVMNASGGRVWATYYGGSTSTDYAASCAIDASGNVYLLGSANSSTVIATAGAHQPNSNGSDDAFLVKFNSAGVRQWATWYGGTGGESSARCATDASGNIYISGQTSSNTSTAIASPNAFQNTGTCFLVKFTGAGVRLWGTYYGDDNSVRPIGLATDATGDVYMSGATTSTGTGMTTLGAHQMVNGGMNDGFLCKFNAGGILMWSTFYGGPGQDQAIGCVVDASGDVYISGSTSYSLGTVFSTPAAYQTSSGGSYDGFLAKFDPTGVRLWGTYYGGALGDAVETCAIDPNGYVYICGVSESTAGIATAGAYQTVTGGNYDMFVAVFNSAGARQWATYYGDTNNDNVVDCTTNATGTVYVCASSTAGANPGVLTSAGSLQPTNGGGSDALIFKLIDCATLPPPPSSATPSVNLALCPGGSTTLSATGSGTLSWYAVPSGSFPISSGTTFTMPPLSSTRTYYVEDKVCGPSASRTAITVTVLPLPLVTVSGPPGVCPGGVAVMTGGGASTYSWMPGSATGATAAFTPVVSGQYTVTGTGANGCVNKSVFNLSIYPLPALSLSASPPIVCAGRTVSINATGAVTYSLNGIPSVPPFGISPTVTGSYNISGATSNGCFASSVITVTVNAQPSLTLASTQPTICAGESVTLSASGAATYTWDFVPGTTEYTITPTGTTDYVVSGTGANGCVGSQTIRQYVDECTGVEKRGGNELMFGLYPNPGNGTYQVRSSAPGVLEVFGPLGQLIHTALVQDNLQPLDLQRYSKGVYLLRFTTKEESRSVRLISE